MFPYRTPAVFRVRIPAPGGEDPRSHPKQAHPPSVVAQVRDLVENTTLTFRTIGQRTGVNSGTVSRWAEKHGWKRPPGSWHSTRRPERRYVPSVVGRVLAMRLRVQAERLVSEIESAPTVDAAALAEALNLLAQARAEQTVRRGKRLTPPPPPPEGEADAPRRKKSVHDRAEAALKGWKGRYAKRNRHHAWMLEKIDK
jgi:hypothetical protein